MKQTDFNWTLLPFLAAALAAACWLSVFLGYEGFAFAGMFLVFFIAAFAASLLLYVLFLAAVALFIDKKKPQTRWEPFYNAMITFVMGLVPALMGVRIHTEGSERVPEGRWLLVGNHVSNLDPLVTGWVLRARRVVFVSKPQNLGLPVVGEFLHKGNFMAIDRENDRAALKTILSAAKLIRDDVTSVAIYPEGTRSRTGELLPFRNGAFKIAQKAAAPVVVAAIRGTELVKKNFPWKPTDVYLEFRAVLDAETVARKNTGEIGEEVRKCLSFGSC